MIRLAKHDKPEILTLNEETWTDEYVALKAAGGSDPSVEGRHRHPQIKSALIDETFDKCAYCEQKLRSSQYGDVEHILPKSAFPHLYVTWSNLTLGCIVCNNSKRDREGFIHPYEDDPNDHLYFVGPMVCHRTGDLNGRNTERGLKLNRTELIEKRTACLAKLQDAIDIHQSLEEGPARDILEEELREATLPDKEFSAFAKHYLIQVGYGFVL